MVEFGRSFLSLTCTHFSHRDKSRDRQLVMMMVVACFGCWTLYFGVPRMEKDGGRMSIPRGCRSFPRLEWSEVSPFGHAMFTIEMSNQGQRN